MRAFKEKIEAESNGRITVELFEGGSFGTNNEMLQALQNGSIQWVAFPVGFFTTIAPDLAIIDLPFLLESPMEAFEVLNGDTPALDQYLASQQLYAPAWMYESPKEISTTKQKIEKLSDFKGLKIRTYSSPVCQDTLTAFGASPQSLASPDVPMALQQGTIDGIECGISFYAPIKLYDMTKYYYKGLLGVPNPIPGMFNKEFIDSLPDDLRALVVDTSVEMLTGEIKDYAIQDDVNNYKLIEGLDTVEVIIPSEELLAECKAAVEPVAEKYINESANMKSIYDELKAAAEANR
jgi:TRAP-type C4-dicarboxylate transport system substrate-binding protein